MSQTKSGTTAEQLVSGYKGFGRKN